MYTVQLTKSIMELIICANDLQNSQQVLSDDRFFCLCLETVSFIPVIRLKAWKFSLYLANTHLFSTISMGI